MPQPTTSLLSRVNPEAAKEKGAGPLLLAWARRTKNNLPPLDRHIEALATVEDTAPYFEELGGEEMQSYVKAVLSEAPVFIDVLGLPYGGPNNGKDNDGNWFSPQTDFMDGAIDSPPVLYGHGSTTGADSDIHGKVHARWYAKDGGWFKVELKRDSPRFEQLYDAHTKGYLRASSGAVPATVEIASNGHIDRWLVGELTLVDLRDGYKPSNGYAITKADLDTNTLFTDYYGDPVMENNPSLLERVSQIINSWREEIAALLVRNPSIDEDDMPKCEKCDEVAAEEAEKLRSEIATMKLEQESKKECLPCREAVRWVGAMVKANKIGLTEALDAVNRFEVDATGWETLKEEVEARDTTVRAALQKAQVEKKAEFFVVSNSGNDPDKSIDSAYMDRMRSMVDLKVK